jgi:hypothetical protein
MSDTTGLWRVQVGKGRSSYKTRYAVVARTEAVFLFNCLNTHSGHKKRLIDPEGRVVARVLT